MQLSVTPQLLQHPPCPSLILYFNQEVQKIKVTGVEHFSRINVSCSKNEMSRWRLSSEFHLGIDLRLELSPAELSPLMLLPSQHRSWKALSQQPLTETPSLLPWSRTEAVGSAGGPRLGNTRRPFSTGLGTDGRKRFPFIPSVCQCAARMHKGLPKFRREEDGESCKNAS